MISRSEDLKDYLKSYPTELPADDHVLSALYTFQAIFRAVNFADIHELHDAEEDIDGLISTAESLRTALENTNPPIWELYCRDTDWLHHIQGYSYWDDRPAERGGQKTMDLTSIEGSCDDNKNLVAFMTFDARNNPAVPVEAITFCSKSLDGFTTETLQEMQRQSFATGNMHIEQVALDKMSLSLIHEMSHSRAVLGSTDAYIDATYENDNGDKETAYGWKAITTLRRQSTKDALDNADSFAYYVAAMYLDNNDWASGFAYTFEDLRQAVSAPQEGEGSDSGDDSDGSDY
ncbi:hypothetical protein PHISCL_03004 [Aspergillus sclerotialis]|uniref:Lysine-specific metallo-endopeptidase domain-containing protein n=1 Tax=Aspergillus sclerotialis TaxID=2070753 RepID=A0A3A2ZN19_9EURO|nr:hypothetical protein PHISCL_03004 [Aspergillus sclerotialis]